ncbi:amidohydrolase family protein [Candidatus Daviesbacteria bacterium]|nr:amidohydrolase family protein [Candidatus Daviesbacteria bacterium]
MTKIITLPGLIDTHVHFREPGATQKEDFETGTKAAIAGGYTTVLDMPNNPEPTVTVEALEKKIQLTKSRIYADVGFHFGATADSPVYFTKVENKVFGLKIYLNHTTGTLLQQDPQVLETIFSSWPKDKVLMVHAEGDTLQKAIELARKNGNKLHACHISQANEVEFIRQAKKEGLNISCEVSCHHLFLTEEDAKRLGPFGTMRPPLGTKKDQEALWQAINDGTIDTIASDHAPHTKEEKLNTSPPPNGVPGLETTLPLLLTAMNEGKLTIERLIELTNINPRRIFNIPEQTDSFVEVDTDKSYVIDPKNLYTKCAWTPFEGIQVRGKIKKVVLKGKLVYDNGQVLEPPQGEIIYPKT